MASSIECRICYEIINTGRNPEQAAALNCGHVFHYKCINPIIASFSSSSTPSCPLCGEEVIDPNTLVNLVIPPGENEEAVRWGRKLEETKEELDEKRRRKSIDRRIDENEIENERLERKIAEIKEKIINLRRRRDR